jgi:hypothetical protein
MDNIKDDKYYIDKIIVDLNGIPEILNELKNM